MKSNQNTDDLKKLPDALLKYSIFDSLTAKETSSLSQVSKPYHKLYKEKLLAAQFIHHVTFGKQDKAEALLKEEKSFHSLLEFFPNLI